MKQAEFMAQAERMRSRKSRSGNDCLLGRLESDEPVNSSRTCRIDLITMAYRSYRTCLTCLTCFTCFSTQQGLSSFTRPN